MLHPAGLHEKRYLSIDFKCSVPLLSNQVWTSQVDQPVSSSGLDCSISSWVSCICSFPVRVEDMVSWLQICRMVIIATYLNVGASCSLGPRISPPKTREPGNIHKKLQHQITEESVLFGTECWKGGQWPRNKANCLFCCLETKSELLNGVLY